MSATHLADCRPSMNHQANPATAAVFAPGPQRGRMAAYSLFPDNNQESCREQRPDAARHQPTQDNSSPVDSAHNASDVRVGEGSHGQMDRSLRLLITTPL